MGEMEARGGVVFQKKCLCGRGRAGRVSSATGPAELGADFAAVRDAAPSEGMKIGGRRAAFHLAALWMPCFLMAAAAATALGVHLALAAADASGAGCSHWAGGCQVWGRHRREGKSFPRRCRVSQGVGVGRCQRGSAHLCDNSTAAGNLGAEEGGEEGTGGAGGGGGRRGDGR